MHLRGWASVWDITGNASTVVKGSFGRYYFGIDNTDIHNYAIRAVNASATVPWIDLNGNDQPDYPSEFTASGIIELTSSRRLADDFRSPHADEFSAAVEHSLSDRSSLTARYTYRKNNNLWSSTWAGIPPAAFNIPTTAVDPITGQSVSYWSIDPAFVGVDSVPTLTNQGDNYNRYSGVDLIYARPLRRQVDDHRLSDVL